jgi:hypothetical protein
VKLYELTGIKKFYEKDVEDVLSSMDKTHKALGRGAFGVALKNSSKPEVVKFWISDSAYDAYVKYISEHPSKYFPKLYSKPKKLSAFFLRTADFPDKVNYVKMEALERASMEEADIIAEIFNQLRKMPSKKEVDAYVEKFLRSANNVFDEYMIKKLNKMVADVRDFCQEMYEMLRGTLGGGHSIDIHSENIMKRKNGELVITDPIYNHEDMMAAEDIKKAMWSVRRRQEEYGDGAFGLVKGRSSSKSKGETK